MQDVSPEPVQALALLPPDENLQIERRWLQDCLAWLKSAPAESRSVRLRRLGDDLCGDPAARERLLAALWNEVRRHPARFLWQHDVEGATVEP